MNTCADCAWLREEPVYFCARHPYRYGWRRRLNVETWELLEAACVRPEWPACPAFRERTDA